MRSGWGPALLALILFECTPVAVGGGEPRPDEKSEECRVRAGERISIRDPRLNDKSCIIEVGAAFSVLWDEYKTAPIRKVEMVITPQCGREDEITLLLQDAYSKLDSMQSLPYEVVETNKPCDAKPQVDVVILQTGI